MNAPSGGPHALAFAFLLLPSIPFGLASGCAFNLSVSIGDGVGGSGGAIPPPPDSSSTGQDEVCQTVSSSTGSSGAGGGGGSCVGPDGTGQTSDICDTMEITPSAVGGPASSNCDPCGGTGGTNPPRGWILCLRAFEIFTAGAAEHLQVCLEQINGAPAYACAYEPVNDCVARMYSATCPTQAAADSCQVIASALCGTNEPFDVMGCTEELKPFGGSALQWIEACVASSDEPECQTAYRSCFDQITSY